MGVLMSVLPKSTKSKNDPDFEWLLCLASEFEMVKKGLVRIGRGNPRRVESGEGSSQKYSGRARGQDEGVSPLAGPDRRSPRDSVQRERIREILGIETLRKR